MEDFEKLLIANAYIKQLKKEKQEFTDDNERLKKIIKSHEDEKIKELHWKKGELKEIKKDRYVKELLVTMNNQGSKIKQLQKDNENLIIRLNQKT